MAWYRIAENVLDAIANAINAKTGHTAPMTPVEMVLEIQNIPTGGGSQITKDEWTLASDWNSNTQSFYYSTYCDRSFNGMQLYHFSNNTASDFTAIIAFIDNAAAGTSMCAYKYTHNGNTSASGLSPGIEYRISAGATITRYKMDYQGV